MRQLTATLESFKAQKQSLKTQTVRTDPLTN